MKAIEQYCCCGTQVHFAVQGGSYFWVCGWNSKMFSSEWKLFSSTFAVVLFILLYKVVLTSRESLDEILIWKKKAVEQYFPVVQLIVLYKMRSILLFSLRVTSWVMVFNLPRISLGLSLCQQRQQLIFRISICLNNGIADSQNYSRREFFHFSTELDKSRELQSNCLCLVSLS